ENDEDLQSLLDDVDATEAVDDLSNESLLLDDKVFDESNFSDSETIDLGIDESTFSETKPVEKKLTDDDLDSLLFDIGEENIIKENKPSEAIVITPPTNFDVGKEEEDLLTIAKNIKGQISDTDWNEVATTARVETYTVVPNDWLFKISKRLFGTGYYYPKIWSLIPKITNTNCIEPGMVLSITTGSAHQASEFMLETFT